MANTMAKLFQNYNLLQGAPLANEDDPNTSTPAAARRWVPPQGKNTALVQLLDGTSCTVTTWELAEGDDEDTEWAQVDQQTAVGTGVPTEITLRSTARAEVFVQLSAVTGNPTGLAVLPIDAAPAALIGLLTSSQISIDSATLHADVDEVESKLDTLASLEGYPHTSEDVDISSGDHTFSIAVNWLFVSVGGVLKYRLTNDGADHSITVNGGALLPGLFAKIIKTGTTASGMVGWKSTS